MYPAFHLHLAEVAVFIRKGLGVQCNQLGKQACLCLAHNVFHGVSVEEGPFVARVPMQVEEVQQSLFPGVVVD